MKDITEALVAYLKEDSDVMLLTDNGEGGYHVYGEELPSYVAPDMPRNAVVVRRASGIPYGGLVPLDRGQVIVAHFGKTPKDAQTLRLATSVALRDLKRHVQGGVLLHTLVPISAPEFRRDPDTGWPYFGEAYEFIASEDSAT